MALLQLIANDGHLGNVSINLANDYIKYNIIFKENEQSYNIPKNHINGDIISLEYFYFMDNNLTMNEFKNIIKNCSCELRIGINKIQIFDFNILIELNPIQKIGNTFVIKIPNFLIPYLIVIALQYSEITLCFNLIHQFENISLLCKITYHEHKNRINYARNMHEIIIQNLYKSGEFIGNATDTITLHGKLLTKGLFVIGQINNIQNITICINKHIRLNYDSIILNSIAHIISDNMFYISFEGSKNYTSLSNESLIGALHLSRINEITMSITLEEINISKYEIYFISTNVMKYTGGYAINRYNDIYISSQQLRNINKGENTNRDKCYWACYWASDINTNIELKNKICPLSKELIDNEYCICATCMNNFSYEMINEWLLIMKNNTCPICRSIWTNFNKYLIKIKI